MPIKKTIFSATFIVMLIAGGILFFGRVTTDDTATTEPTTFAECVKAGNPILESYPRQCRSGDLLFIEDIGNELEKTDLITIDTPRPNQTITSPLNISGQARGFWYFEGSFTVVLKDADGNSLGFAIAEAQGDWAVRDFVKFSASFEYSAPTTTNGTLLLQKSNPSGLPENDSTLSIPIMFE